MNPQQQQYNRLKVEDALTYLDRVKQQFCNQPQVYNDFLDIMKEFKSQTIDTPGVITRVSTLFHGHKDLIVGFNTFLPLGYRIELNKATDQINIFHPGNKNSLSYEPTQPVNNYTQQNHLNKSHHVQPSVNNNNMTDLPLRGGGTETYQESNVNLGSNHKPPRQSSLIPGAQSVVSEHTSGVAGFGGPSIHAIGMNGIKAVSGAPPAPEFNHAILYVNKIKSRYQNNPDTYKAFLDILHNYQKEQTLQKESQAIGNVSSSHNSSNASSCAMETEVYQKVARLFMDQPDLLNEFGQFLPETGQNTTSSGIQQGGVDSNLLSLCTSSMPKKASSSLSNHTSTPKRRRRLSSNTNSQHRYKLDFAKDSITDIGKYGSLLDFAFFDKVRKSLGDVMYTEFLKCLKLYNIREIRMSPIELMQLIHPFCLKMPELKKRMKDLLNQKEDSSELLLMPPIANQGSSGVEGGGEIDYASCKRYDVSYLALPRDHVQAKCSGRSSLCLEVLNDTYVSFPSWSEDSSSVMKKTVAEEMVFRCEEDRYQLDIVLENLNSTMNVLKFVESKMEKMTPDELSTFQLDNTFGGQSETLHRKTIQGLYGESSEIILEALKQSPLEVVPMVLKRLKGKVEEWREWRRKNNKTWNEQNQKYYLKSLDHLGLSFKQVDTKQLRSKALLQEIELAYEQNKGSLPHLSLLYPGGERFMEDAACLLIHHVKRQTNINVEEKRKIKQLLRQFLPDLFELTRGELSDDESGKDCTLDNTLSIMHDDSFPCSSDENKINDYTKDNKIKKGSNRQSKEDEMCSIFYVNQTWYIFLRLHNTLCKRLHLFHVHANKMIKDAEEGNKCISVSSTAVSLGLRSPAIDPTKCYFQFLTMIKNYLDGHLEFTTYEEQLREMFKTSAYVAYTIDKLIQNIVRQLQQLVTDEICTRLFDLYNSDGLCKPSSSVLTRSINYDTTGPNIPIISGELNKLSALEAVYQCKAERLLVGENCFRITLFRRSKLMNIDLIPSNSSHATSPSQLMQTWIDQVKKMACESTPVKQEENQYIMNDLKNNYDLNQNANSILNEIKVQTSQDNIETKFDISSEKNIDIRLIEKNNDIRTMDKTKKNNYPSNQTSKSDKNRTIKQEHDISFEDKVENISDGSNNKLISMQINEEVRNSTFFVINQLESEMYVDEISINVDMSKATKEQIGIKIGTDLDETRIEGEIMTGCEDDGMNSPKLIEWNEEKDKAIDEQNSLILCDKIKTQGDLILKNQNIGNNPKRFSDVRHKGSNCKGKIRKPNDMVPTVYMQKRKFLMRNFRLMTQLRSQRLIIGGRTGQAPQMIGVRRDGTRVGEGGWLYLEDDTEVLIEPHKLKMKFFLKTMSIFKFSHFDTDRVLKRSIATKNRRTFKFNSFLTEWFKKNNNENRSTNRS